MSKIKNAACSLVYLIGLLLVFNFLASCASKPDDPLWWTAAKGCKNVGIFLPEDDNERYEKHDRPLLEREIKKRVPGVTLQHFNAQGVADKQEYQAERALSNGACILVLDPVEARKAAVIVQKAKYNNVPVIAYDRIIEDDDTAFYVSFDNLQVGQLQGRYILDQYHQGTYGLKKGAKMVMINGAITDPNALKFRQGAIEELQGLIDSGDLQKVFDEYTPYWDKNIAGVRMKELLAKHGNDIQIVYVANDNMADGVIEALADKKLNGKVLVTGQDATVKAIQNILKGDQAMTIYKPIIREAEATAQLVAALSKGIDPMDLINGKTETATGAEIPSVLADPILVDKNNNLDRLINDGFVVRQEVCQGITVELGVICK